MPHSRFVFMHYENPTVDSKLLSNRQMVAKYAMLGRQKGNTNTNGNSKNKSSTTSTTTTTTTTADDNNGNISNATSPLSSNGGEPDSPDNLNGSTNTEWLAPHQQYSPNSTRYETSPDPPSNASTTSGSTFDNPTHSPASNRYSLDLSLPFESFPDGVSDRHGSASSDNSDSLFVPNAFLQINGFPYDPRETVDDFNVYSLDNSTGSKDRLEQKKREQLRKRNNANKALSRPRNGSRQNGNEKAQTNGGSGENIPYFGSPTTLISGAPSDPFNSLPIKANAHTHELLYQYMNARLISSVYAQGSPETFQRIKKMRHTVWWPLCVKSEASLNALVAYVESTPGLPIKSRTKDFLFSHVQAAIASVRQELSSPTVATNDSICFAVVLLMLTAQREGSTETYATHAAGLATLLKHRTDAIRRHGEQDDTVEQLRSFYSGEMRDRCRYCQSAYNTRATSPSLSVSSDTGLPTDIEAFTSALIPRGEGFRELIRMGHMSAGMTQFVEPAMIWSTLAERARRDKLSAAVGATHAWIDEGEFSLKGPFHALDTACHTAVRICFYLSSWLDWQHSCSAVRRMAKAAYMALEKADVELLLQKCPQVICWLSLMVGPLCDDEARNWFSLLLNRSRDALGYGILDFAKAIELFSQLFVWSGTMTPGAEKFWNQGYFDDAQPGDVFFGTDERIWEL